MYGLRMQSSESVYDVECRTERRSHNYPDIQSVYAGECIAEYRSHSSIFYMNIFECRAECRTHSSIFKVCMVLNAELNVDPTARCSRYTFSNAEMNIDPIPRYSKYVWC